MKVRLVYALMLATVLCASMAGPALADAPVVTYDDTEATTDFVHKAGVGGEYVRNGAFDDWAESDGMPIGWKQYGSSTAPARKRRATASPTRRYR
jgi:hypothetical protein